MANNQGRHTIPGGDFLLLEAECSDLGDSDKENQPDTDDEDFIDNAHVEQGNTLALFQTIEKQAGEVKLNLLKRKLLLSPAGNNSSPRSETSFSQRGAKRSLLGELNREHEASSPASAVQVFGSLDSGGEGSGVTESSSQNSSDAFLSVMGARNTAAAQYSIFKQAYLCSFADLTRPFKNDKTTNHQWVAAVFGVRDDWFASCKQVLSRDCSYLHASLKPHEKGSIVLMLLDFNIAKCRDTVRKLLSDLLNVHPSRLLLQPPKLRSVSAAMYWYKLTLSPHTFTSGQLPKWIESQITMTDSCGEVVKFDFSQMVQWAFDNDYTEESLIAYNYALLAETEANARAWLSLTNQAKICKDVSTMVRHYQRAITSSMSMSAYINYCCERVSETGSWLPIMHFLKFQGTEPIRFVNAMKPWLKGIPKKNCLAFIGPSNTGKSLFSNSLLHFLRGRVLSFANSASHFWLQPLTEGRVALIDDATMACLKYCDTYLRNVFDGYPVNIDRKHRSSVQCKAPPLLITSNVDINAEEKFCYLKSRITSFYFKEECPLDQEGNPMFKINDADWKCFFKRLWPRLELSDQEEGEDDCGPGAFVISARGTNAAY